MFCPGLRMTYALLLGVVRMNGCITIYTKPLVPDGAARRCSELRLNLTALVQLSLLSRRSPSSGSGAGAEQWYKTIAKLMQGRNSIPHLHSEHRFWDFQSGSHPLTSSYLVDPASSHMLVLKIKPCMSKYKHLYRETANGSLKQLWFI